MKTELTNRGFSKILFKDYYNTLCSAQDSSLAGERCIWLGIEHAEPQIMAMDARSAGVVTDQTSGWVAYPLPSEVFISTRMHLSQQQVKNLLPVLTHFAEHGKLPRAETSPSP